MTKKIKMGHKVKNPCFPMLVGTTEGLSTGEREGCREEGEAELAPTKLTVKETGPAVSINPLFVKQSTEGASR